MPAQVATEEEVLQSLKEWNPARRPRLGTTGHGRKKCTYDGNL